MKKIIITSLTLFTLVSCGSPKIENPEDALKQNQTLLIENLEKTITYYPKNGNSLGKINLDLNAKEGKVNMIMNYNSDYSNNGLNSSSNIKIKLKANAKEGVKVPIKEISGNIDLNLIVLKNKFLFKLNSLNIDDIEKNQQLAMIPTIIGQFQKKWYFIDSPVNPELLVAKEGFLKNYKQIIPNLKNNTLLEFVKENKNKNFYDYDVKISEKAIINIATETKKIISKEKQKQILTEDEISEIKKSVSEFNKDIKINIKIDKSNLDLFTLNIRSNKIKDLIFIIENTKTNFNIKINSVKNKIDLKLVGKKSKNKLNGTILITSEKKELFNGTFLSSYNKGKSSFSIEGKAKNEGEELKIKLEISDITTKKSVKIEEPKESKDFQEVIQGAMGLMMRGATSPTSTLPEIKNSEEKTVEIKK